MVSFLFLSWIFFSSAASASDFTFLQNISLFLSSWHISITDLAAYHGLLLNYSLRGQAAQAQNFLDKRIMTSQTPNRNTFTMVIDAYTRSKSSSAGEKAEKLLNKMRELHAAGNSEMEPDDVTYASIIRCKRRRIRDMTEFEKFVLMRELQIETWPFQHQSDYKSSVQND